jgi:hypothetical protein
MLHADFGDLSALIVFNAFDTLLKLNWSFTAGLSRKNLAAILQMAIIWL